MARGHSVTTGSMRELGAALVLGLVIGGCSSGNPVPTRIVQAEVTSDGRGLSLGVDACNADTTVEILEETSEAVTVRAMARPPGMDGDDCADRGTLCLSEPLDGRPVIDAKTGDAVQVETIDYLEVPCPIAGE